jgi:ERCC4-related helicase
VLELLKAGFTTAVALPEALGVPSAGEVAPIRVRDVAAAGGESEPAGMLQTRLALAERFTIAERIEGELPLLVTTEHGARGLDFKNIDCVFLLGLPQRVDSYVHVAGRTAREGRRGRAVSFLYTEEERMRMEDFRRELGVKVEMIDLNFLKP